MCYPLIAAPLGTAFRGVVDFESWFLGVAASWLAVTFVLSIMVSSFGCPRCGRTFHAKGPFHNSMAGRCMHCALPKWSEDDPDDVGL